jgi:predicted Zn-dependent protease
MSVAVFEWHSGDVMRRWVRFAAASLIALNLAACASLDPFGKPANDAPPLPPGAPRITGVETPESSQHKRLVDMFGGEYRAYATERYLNQILARLAAVSERPGETYRVTILNTPVVNAFALPNGNVYVTRGMLALANDSAELAAVMAHELAHITAGHAGARAELEKDQQLISRVADVLQKDRGTQVQARGIASLANFSRQQEFEADRLGIAMIAKAGYDPYGASRFLAALGRSSALRASLFNQRAQAQEMSSHPSTPERVNRAISAARAISAPGIGEAARDDYLSAIDNNEFGDATSEGVVRGRRYAHPRLGFGFLAPDGFMLENTSQAVLGVIAGGAEAMRLDSVTVSSETSLETYLASRWIEGLQKDTIQSLTINGLPAATALAKAGEWQFRVGVVRLGSDVYRLIFATTQLSERSDQKFKESLQSFRRLSNDEAGRVTALRLQIVRASDSDTVQTLAGRMALSDRPLEWFLLLNGLDRPGPIKAGERYKIITE